MKVFLVLAVALLASCNPTLDVPLRSSTHSASTYFWSSDSDLTLRASSGLDHVLNLRHLGGTLQLTDVVSSDRIALDVQQAGDSLRISGFTSSTFFKLPASTHLSALDTIVERKGMYVPGVIYHSDGTPSQVVICTDSGGVYTLASDSSWQRRGNSGLQFPTAIAQDHNGSRAFYIGSSTGKIVMSADLASWAPVSLAGLPSDGIAALAVDGSSNLYAGLSNTAGLYELKNGATTWVLTSLYQDRAVSALLAFSSPAAILAGTRDGHIGVFGGTSIDRDLGCGRVYSFGFGFNKIVLASTEKGVFEAGDISGAWSQAPWSSANSLTDVRSTVLSSSLLFVATSNRLYSVSSNTGSSATLLGTVPSGTIIRLIRPDQILALTTTGVFGFDQPTSKWSAYHKGLEFTFTPDAPGGLLMLKGDMAIGSTWRAGTLVEESVPPRSYRIRATVIDHVDSLGVNGRVSDVLVVRYRHEVASGASTPLPYWVAYFARGLGLVQLDEVAPDGTLTRLTGY